MSDLINHPPHYTQHSSGIECIQITEHMGFCLGNAVKYIWRADLKDSAIEDLQKARWYLDREIAKRGGQANAPHPSGPPFTKTEALAMSAWALRYLPGAHLLVLTTLACTADPQTEIAWVSPADIAPELHMTPERVDQELCDMREAGLIIPVSDGLRRGFKLTMPGVHK